MPRVGGYLKQRRSAALLNLSSAQIFLFIWRILNAVSNKLFHFHRGHESPNLFAILTEYVLNPLITLDDFVFRGDSHGNFSESGPMRWNMIKFRKHPIV